MNRQEISRVIAILQAEYPSHAIPNERALVASWEMNLGSVPVEVAMAAASAWVNSGERFFPTSGQLRQLIITESGSVPSLADAWEMVLDRMYATYPGHPAPPWDAPVEVKQALKAIGGMDVVRHSENLGMERSAFAKMYEVYRQRAARDVDLSNVILGEGIDAVGSGDATTD